MKETVSCSVFDGTVVRGVQLAPEIEEGNREYKLMLTNLTEEQLTHRITQLNWRLNEGNGEAFYLVGVEDNGNQLGLTDAEMSETLRNLQYMADQVGCEMSVKQMFAGTRGKTAEIHMKRKERKTVDITQLAIAVAGDVDSGKSTLVGVLTSGRVDNGKGLARSAVCTHNHELESGRTSSISHHSLHFNKSGQVVNAEFQLGSKSHARVRALSELELADGNTVDRVVSLIDLAGHAKYLKTTLHGMIGHHPQYTLICVSAVSGLQSMTTEHIGISLYLKVPLIIVITKIDLATPVQLDNTMKQVTRVLTGPFKQAVVVRTREDLDEYLRLLNASRSGGTAPSALPPVVTSDCAAGATLPPLAPPAAVPGKTYAPVFLTSNVLGSGLELLQSCLHEVPTEETSARVITADSSCMGAIASVSRVEVRILGSIGKTEEVSSSSDDDDGNMSADEESASASATKAASTVQSTDVGVSVSAPFVRRCNFNPRGGQAACRVTKTVTISTSAGIADESATSSPSAASSGAGTRVDEGHGDSNQQQQGMVSSGNSLDSLSGYDGIIDCDSFAEAVAVQPKSTDAASMAAAMAAGLAEFSDYIEYSATTTATPEASAANSSPSTNAGSSTKVLIGYVQTGVLRVRDSLQLGPTSTGLFIAVTVSSIRLNNVPIQCATAGQTVTFKVSTSVASPLADSNLTTPLKKALSRGSLQPSPSSAGGNTVSPFARRSTASGLVLLSPTPTQDAGPKAYMQFDCELIILNHPNKIRVNYEPIVHIGCVKQAARIMSIRKISGKGIVPSAAGSKSGLEAIALQRSSSDDTLNTVCNGEKAIVRFKFLYYPEYLAVDSALIIREERTKGVGTVLRLVD